MTDKLSQILEKTSVCRRINKAEALLLLDSIVRPDDIYMIGSSALKNRLNRFAKYATFVNNLTINPSNICSGTCGFCHYRVTEDDPKSYILSEEDIFSQIKNCDPVEVHIVGGMNKIWSYERYLSLIEEIYKNNPEIYIKAFTAVEIDYFARHSNKSNIEILQGLKQKGLKSLTGGGAELFSPRMRKKYCPDKLSAKKWLEIHKIAHSLYLSTNATMLYGLEESNIEIVEHLLMLRDLQDETNGFSAFIPLAYQQGEKLQTSQKLSPIEHLKIIALSRIILDNFSHIKAYWPMIGLETASTALSWGADDLDGTLQNEKIAHAGENKTPRFISSQTMIQTIQMGGFIPVERSGEFKKIDTNLKKKSTMHLNIKINCIS